VYNKCVILLSKWVKLNAAPCAYNLMMTQYVSKHTALLWKTSVFPNKLFLATALIWNNGALCSQLPRTFSKSGFSNVSNVMAARVSYVTFRVLWYRWIALRLGAHWQLWLLSYLVARMENTALYESARTGNFYVAATENLLPEAAWPILEATEKLLITIGRTCFSLSARTCN